MASLNVIVLVGNLTRDPELRQTPNGKSVCQFGLAVNDGDRAPLFVDVECWEKTAENVAKYLSKGSPAAVEGKLLLDQWEKDGQKRSKHKVRAFRVQFLGSKGGGGQAEPDASSAPAPSGDGFEESEDIPF